MCPSGMRRATPGARYRPALKDVAAWEAWPEAGRQAGERHSCTHAEEGEASKADLRPVMDTEGKEARPPTLFTLGCSVYPEKTHPRLWPYSKPARASEL